jgi:hypothetical protein
MTWIFFRIVDMPRPGGAGRQLLRRTSERMRRVSPECETVIFRMSWRYLQLVSHIGFLEMTNLRPTALVRCPFLPSFSAPKNVGLSYGSTQPTEQSLCTER